MTAGDQIVFIAAGVGRIDQISPRGTNQLPVLLNDLATAAASLKASLACLRRRGPSLLSDHRTKNGPAFVHNLHASGQRRIPPFARNVCAAASQVPHEPSGDQNLNRRRPSLRQAKQKHLPMNSSAKARPTVAECPVRYCAVQPPSTEIDVPVIWSAAGEHRKATVPPSCAGETKSRDGCFSARSSLTASF